MMNKSIIILIIIILVICLCLLLYVKFNRKSKELKAGFMTFYDSEPEFVVVSNYLSNVFYLTWLMETYPNECLGNYFGEYALNLIRPCTDIIKTNSNYYTKLYNEIPLNEPNLTEYYDNTLKKFNTVLENKQTTEINRFLRNDCLTYYLSNTEHIDKSKIQHYVSKYYDIISIYLNEILNDSEVDAFLIEYNDESEEVVNSLKNKYIINEKVVIYITIIIEFMLKLLIKENVQIMDPPDDFFVRIGRFNVAVTLLIKHGNKKPYKVVAKFGHKNTIECNDIKIDNDIETYNSMNEIFGMDNDKDILARVLFNYKLNNINDTREFQQRLIKDYNISISPYSVIPAYCKIFEYIDGGDLSDTLRKSYRLDSDDVSLPYLIEEVTKTININLRCIEKYIELAIRFIEKYHPADYIYCDWKLPNIGENQDYNAVIIDTDLLKIEKIIKKEQRIIQTHTIYPTFEYGPTTPEEKITLAREIFYRQLGNEMQVLQEDEFDELVEALQNEDRHQNNRCLIEYYKKYDNYMLFYDIVMSILSCYVEIDYMIKPLFDENDPFLQFCYTMHDEISKNILYSNHNHLYLLGLYDVLTKNRYGDKFSDRNTIHVISRIMDFIHDLSDDVTGFQIYHFRKEDQPNKKTIRKFMCDLINYFYFIPLKYCFEKGEIDRAYEMHDNRYYIYTLRDNEIYIDRDNVVYTVEDFMTQFM